MSKSSSVDEFMQNVQDSDFMMDERVVFAEDYKAWKAGTQATVTHAFVLNTTHQIFLVVQPDGASDDDVVSLETRYLRTLSGDSIPEKATQVNGQLSFGPTPVTAPIQNGVQIPMTTEAIPTPIYPTQNADAVLAILNSFAPGQALVPEFHQFYLSRLGADPAYLQQVMQAHGALSTQWSPQQTAQIYASILQAFQLPVPQHVQDAANGVAAAPAVPATPAVPQATLPPSPMPAPAATPVPAVAPEAAAPVVVNAPGGLPAMPGVPGVPAVPGVPTPISVAPQVQPLPPAPVGEAVAEAPKAEKRGGSGKKRASKAKTEGGEATGNGKLSLDQLAATEALLKVYQLDPANFEANVDAALEAIQNLVG